MSDARWWRGRVRSWLLIDGRRVPCNGWQVDYELNAIPRATAYLPLGRDLDKGEASPAHGALAGLREQTPVEIWARLEDRAKSDADVSELGVPEGDFKVFEGLTAGGGYVKNNQGVAQYLLSCNHWLVTLNQASCLSQSSHPANPARYAYGAVQLAGTGGINWTPLTAAHRYVTPGALAKDAWGECLYKWMTALAGLDGIWAAERGLKGAAGNTQAADAIARLAPGGKRYVPLALRSTLAVDVDIANELANDVANLTFSPGALAHQTLWDLLVAKFCSEYMLAVAPRVSDALVVPFLPGNRDVAAQAVDLTADQYVGVQIEGPQRRPLRAYGILSGLSTRTGVEAVGEAPPDQAMGIGGWYDVAKPGAVIIQPGPAWTNMILSPSSYADKASGGDLTPIGNAYFPGAGQATGANAQAQARATQKIKPLLDAIAQCRYAQELLQGRYALVAGPLRLDICPGTPVKIHGAAETFIADQDRLGIPYYGEVLRVSLMASAQNGAAGAAYHVGYPRTEAENGDDKTSVGGHPLYEKGWPGAPLVEPS